MEDSKTIGLIGVGLLGSAIAEKLYRSSMRLVGFDLDSSRLAHLESCGAQPADDACTVVQGCKTILLSLPTSGIALKVIQQNLAYFSRDQLVIDTTTGEPMEMLEIDALLAKVGVRYVEAMVAGSSEQLRQHKAPFLLGGEAADIDRLGWLWPMLTDRQFHVGAIGAASRFKLIHNHVLGLHRLVLAEALTLAESMGFALDDTLRILQQTPAASRVMESKGAKMVEGDFSPQAKLGQHLKDVRLILDQAQRCGARVPLINLHRELLEQAVGLGLAEADNCAVIEAFRASAVSKAAADADSADREAG